MLLDTFALLKKIDELVDVDCHVMMFVDCNARGDQCLVTHLRQTQHPFHEMKQWLPVEMLKETNGLAIAASNDNYLVRIFCGDFNKRCQAVADS